MQHLEQFPDGFQSYDTPADFSPRAQVCFRSLNFYSAFSRGKQTKKSIETASGLAAKVWSIARSLTAAFAITAVQYW